MARNELGELVQKAKGEDRSLREYAKASEVDAAIISKIISGTYIPKRPGVLLKLTSDQAAPRGGVTYAQMLKAMDSSKSFQDGIKAGMVATATAATVAAFDFSPLTSFYAGIAGAAVEKLLGRTQKKTEKRQKVEEPKDDTGKRFMEYVERQEKFRNAALQIVVTTMAKRGIACTIKKASEMDIDGDRPEECLSLLDQPVTRWWLSFKSMDKDFAEQFTSLPVNQVKDKISSFTIAPPDPKRKVSVVVDDDELYRELAKYKGKNSYRGEMSIILIDTKRNLVVREEYIAHYDEADKSRELLIL